MKATGFRRALSISQILAGVMVALLCGLSQASFAQSSPGVSEQAGQSQEGQLEEIVVTAQKRSESLQTVPVSVQVVSSEALTQQNYNDLESLSRTMPGLTSVDNGLNNTLSIRGVSSGGNSAFDQAVATFVDDIYVGRSLESEATFLDLDRIEVLKGPQSTFFGMNAVAGALNIVSKKPGDTFDAWGRLLYGSFGTYAAEGAVGGPITDTFGARLAVTRNGDGGWIKDVNDGQYQPIVDNSAIRLTLDFHPSERLDVILKTEASQHSEFGTSGADPSQWTYCPPPAPYTVAFDFPCSVALAQHVPMGLNNDENSTTPGSSTHLSTFLETLTINYHVGVDTLTSVTGFNNYHAFEGGDFGYTGVPDIIVPQREKYNQFSQEFRLTSPTGGTIEYMAGAYFQTDTINNTRSAILDFVDPIGLELGVPADDLPVDQHLSFYQRENIFSAFGSVNWNITNRLKLTTGLRATLEGKFFDGGNNYGTTPTPPPYFNDAFVAIPPAIDSIWTILNGPPGNVGRSRFDRGLMPSGGLQYQLNPDAMAYVSYSRGWKAGGYNGVAPYIPFVPGANLGYGPEFVNDYEIGIKSTWFEDRVRVNVDLFREDYDDLQVSAGIPNPLIPGSHTLIIANAATSRSQGLELETDWAVSRDLRLSANIEWMDAHYLSYPNAPQTSLQTFCAGSYVLPDCSRFSNPVPANANFAGQPLPYSPRFTASVNAAYTISFPSDYKLTALLAPYYTSSYNPDPDGIYPSLGNYVRLDASLAFKIPDRRWEFDLIGKNVTNRVIPVSIGVPVSSKEEPANISAQLRFHW
jgi:iron complex outermembrane receptor protein